MKFLDLFAGIGGFRLALESQGHECVGFCEKDKFALKSYKAIHDTSGEIEFNDIRKVTDEQFRQLRGTVDIITAGFPCFSEGTLIQTNNGLKEIEKVTESDLVMTHTNVFKSVLNTMIKQKNGIYKLKIQSSPITYVTEEHPYYVREMTRVWNNEKRKYERIFSEPKWINVSDLEVGKHFAGASINKEDTNPYNITSEEAWLLGRYLADGYVQNGKRAGRKNSYNNKVTFCIGKKKLDEFLSNVKTYNVGLTEERTVFKTRIINKRFTELCLMCGKGAENKEFPSVLLNLPIELLEDAINGYIGGDGHENNGVFSANSVSKKLIYSLGQAVHKVYKTPVSITITKRDKTTVIEGRTVNQKDTWSIRFRKDFSKQNNAVFINDMMWYPVKEKEYLDDWTGFVYNFEVEDDNSYVANNITVHNCQPFSKAGKREGFRDLTRGTMFFEIARATNEIQPSILLLENVKGLLNHEKGETFRVILETLDELGYDAEWEVLNSKHYGVAHNRERVYIIGYLRGKCRRKIFPIGRPVGTSNAQVSILAHRESFRRNTQVYDPSGVIETLDTATGGGRGAYTIDNSGIKIKEATKTGYAIAKAGDSINTEQPESKTRRGRVGRKLANTLMTLPYQAVVENSYRIRKLTPKECWRLQSFPDWAFEKASSVVSDSQLYKQAGNTVTINVVIEIIKLIDKAIIEGDLIIERSTI